MGLANLTVSQNIIHTLSERIVEAQKPIRILNSLKWPAAIEQKFFEKNVKNCQQLISNPTKPMRLILMHIKKSMNFMRLNATFAVS